MKTDTNPPVSPIELIALADAVLCCNCEVISKRRVDGRCAGCESESTIGVQSIVGAMAKAACEYIEAAGRV